MVVALPVSRSLPAMGRDFDHFDTTVSMTDRPDGASGAAIVIGCRLTSLKRLFQRPAPMPRTASVCSQRVTPLCAVEICATRIPFGSSAERIML